MKLFKSYKNHIFSFLIVIFVLSLPVTIFAQNRFVECDTNCGYNDLLKLVNNIINWMIVISIPIAAGVFAWAGLKLMMTGVADKRSEARAMIMKVFWGFVIILSAWIIVSTVVNALLAPEFKTEVDKVVDIKK